MGTKQKNKDSALRRDACSNLSTCLIFFTLRTENYKKLDGMDTM